jgi:hypothetical protein
MNATTIGKSLIFINVILSIVFASWALGIFTNRIDWPGGGTPSVPGERALGEVGKRDKEIKEAEGASKLATGNWQAWSKALKNVETVQRPQARTWFATKLKSLEEGANPVTSLAYATDGKLQVGAEGKPIPGPGGTPLVSRAAFRKQMADIDAKILQLVAQAKNDLTSAEALTIQINGIREGNLVKQKGLRDLLAELAQARQNAIDETEYVRPFRFNRQAEAELLQKRQASLAQRIEELKNVSTASR